MKRQVFTIHGGDAFATHEDFLEYIRSLAIDLSWSQRKGWKSTLQEALGDEYEVISPRMPNAQNASYEVWKVWFEKHIPFMRDDITLVGHSLGGIFLAKYLSENRLPVKIAGTFLVAAPFELDTEGRVMEFILPDSLALFDEQGGKIFLYQSTDDQVVPFAELSRYRRALPSAKTEVFEDRGHFDQEQLPEIVRDIQGLRG